MRRVLIGIDPDDPEPGFRALGYATTLLDPKEWEFLIVSVVNEFKYARVISLSPTEVSTAMRRDEENAREIVREAEKRARRNKFIARGMIARGDAGLEIINIARSQNVELVILGYRKHGRVRSFIGSTHRKIIEKIDSNVLIVK